MRSVLERVHRRREQTVPLLEKRGWCGLGVESSGAGPDLVCERIYSGLLSLIKQSTKDSNEAALHSPTTFRSIVVSPANLTHYLVPSTLNRASRSHFPRSSSFFLFESSSASPLRMSLVPKQSFRSLSSPPPPSFLAFLSFLVLRVSPYPLPLPLLPSSLP